MDHELQNKVTKANAQMLRKFWVIGFAIIATLVYCIVAPHSAAVISDWVAIYVPSIAKLVVNQTGIGNLPANFFGVLTFLMPAFLVLLTWGESPLLRWRYGLIQSGRSPSEFLLTGYLLLFPFGLFVLYVMYAAPIELPSQPRLWGQHVIHLMINTYAGLFVFGGIAIFATAVVGAAVVFCFLLPLSAIKSQFLRG